MVRVEWNVVRATAGGSQSGIRVECWRVATGHKSGVARHKSGVECGKNYSWRVATRHKSGVECGKTYSCRVAIGPKTGALRGRNQA